MAGMKGRSGGPRANSGGRRAGAGRKPTAAPIVCSDGVERDPLDFLLAVQNGLIEASTLQVRAAIAAAQYVHAKKGEGGKKDDKADAAEKVATEGRFKPSSPPSLSVVRSA